MKGLSLGGDIKKCAESGEGYRFDDIMLYPVTVRDYAMFYACSSALTLRMSMLPVKYAVMSYAEAIFSMALDQEIIERHDEYCTCFAKFMHLLAMSMHVTVDAFELIVDANDRNKLKAIVVKQETSELGEDLVRLETGKLGQIRKIIATLNGKDLPDEADNTELIEAEDAIHAIGVTSLKADLSDLKASVAAYYKVRIRELNDWTIYEFEKARSAIERMTRCVICGIGESGGMVKWEKGNPFPSLFFDRERENDALIDMADFQRKMGGAVATVDDMPNMPV